MDSQGLKQRVADMRGFQKYTPGIQIMFLAGSYFMNSRATATTTIGLIKNTNYSIVMKQVPKCLLAILLLWS